MLGDAHSRGGDAMTSPRRIVQGTAVAVLVLLALAPRVAAADEVVGASPPEVVVGVEGRTGTAYHLSADVRATSGVLGLAGANLFARRGLLRVGIAIEGVPMDYKDNRWIPPGQSLVTRSDLPLTLTAGLSSPATFLGDWWLWRHMRTDLLAEAGASYTWLHEDLGGGGPGNRTWNRCTPLVGLRAGVSMRFGGRFHGFVGLAGFYRHALVQDHVTTVTGRREPVIGDSVGLVLFGGTDLRLGD